MLREIIDANIEKHNVSRNPELVKGRTSNLTGVI